MDCGWGEAYLVRGQGDYGPKSYSLVPHVSFEGMDKQGVTCLKGVGGKEKRRKGMYSLCPNSPLHPPPPPCAPPREFAWGTGDTGLCTHLSDFLTPFELWYSPLCSLLRARVSLLNCWSLGSQHRSDEMLVTVESPPFTNRSHGATKRLSLMIPGEHNF